MDKDMDMVHIKTKNNPFKWASHNSINMLGSFMNSMKTLDSSKKTKL